MKKLFASFLVVIFLFNTVGYFFVFSYNQYVLQQDIRNLIKAHHFDHSCKILKIPVAYSNKDFSRLNKEEFRYKGVLYDLISEEINGNIFTIRCIVDKQENNLISGFSHSQEYANSQNNSGNAKHTAALLHLMVNEALFEKPLTSNFTRFPSVVKYQIPVYPLYSFLIPPFSPPPEFT
ncbi:MAG: hypothetical protein WCL00_01390 [Bacteroidota bacterium]